ncbi:SDR family NAD(P)-dependent oxidoreductase [Subtercola lobariae]|uniref:Short-chain dehydrogenase n=1 Tax=Subtercola lobariae TaxID=1588641 RepID=A0A917AZY5_9MICO|nr:SDR family NAD(P)-dependent oxidoreductase [Subtercola lobariae]GGF10678.1 short-chain dehydrogenase [Subtercola lobariae]
MTTTLVTGATRGVGREVARRLAAAGHTVYLGARNLESGTEVAAEIGATPIQLDATDAASIAEAVARIRSEAGALDVLVNNAGIAGAQRPPGEATIDDLRLVFDTNVFGAAAVLDAFTPLLEASETPVVVNVSSAVGSLTLNASPDTRWSMLAYPMSKAALNMLTIQYAQAHPRWRVNSATPGLTATEFTGPRPADAPSIDELRASGMQINTVEQGAEIIVQLAQLGPDGQTGTFVGNEGPLPW